MKMGSKSACVTASLPNSASSRLSAFCHCDDCFWLAVGISRLQASDDRDSDRAFLVCACCGVPPLTGAELVRHSDRLASRVGVSVWRLFDTPRKIPTRAAARLADACLPYWLLGVDRSIAASLRICWLRFVDYVRLLLISCNSPLIYRQAARAAAFLLFFNWLSKTWDWHSWRL